MKKEFNWNDFKTFDNTVIHCKTKEEAEDFCKQMDLHGLCWIDNTSYLADTQWDCLKENTCYNSRGSYSDKKYYEDNYYTILEWSDYMEVNKNEQVKHPAHYNRDGGMECIDEMILVFGIQETMSFCKLNAWKYRYRAGLKGSAEEDIAKSDWYLNKYKELKECDKSESRYDEFGF